MGQKSGGDIGRAAGALLSDLESSSGMLGKLQHMIPWKTVGLGCVGLSATADGQQCRQF